MSTEYITHNIGVSSSAGPQLWIDLVVHQEEAGYPEGWTLDEIADVVRDALLSGIPGMTSAELYRTTRTTDIL